MSTSLIVIEGGDLLAALGSDFEVAFDLAKAEKAPATRKAFTTRSTATPRASAPFLRRLRQWHPTSPQRHRPQSLRQLAG
jgi:hypothetical protein